MTCESTYSSGEGSSMKKCTWQRREAVFYTDDSDTTKATARYLNIALV